MLSRKYIFIIIAALGFFAFAMPKAHAAITFDASSSFSFTTRTTATTTFTVGSGNSESLFICIATAAPSSTGVSVNGSAATRAVIGSTSTRNAGLWYLLNVGAGTVNVSTTFSATTPGGMVISSFFGVNQSAPVDATSSKFLSSKTPSTTITTSVANDLVIDCSATGAATSTAGGGQTVIATSTGSNNLANSSYRLATAASTYTQSWTVAVSGVWAQSAAGFKPDSPDATSVTYTVGGDGGRSGDSVTITGKNFGAPLAGSRATCNGAAGTGCVQFVAGGTDTVADANVTAWSDTSITFTVPAGLASNGGVSALQVSAASLNDATPLTYYVYPRISAVVSLGTNAARIYNAADSDGLVMLSGDHFGAGGTSTILAFTATLHNATSGPCTVSGFATSTACFEVPPTIATATYSGNIILNRASDNKQATTSLSILPRILTVSPTSTTAGTVVRILGDHLCEPAGTCPVSPNRSTSTNNVAFGANNALDGDFVAQTGGAGNCNGAGAGWTNGEICVQVPAAAPSGSAAILITSNSNTSTVAAFTVIGAPAPGAPGTPTYSPVGSSTLTVNWTAGTGSATYYKIERATSSQSYAQISTTSALLYADSGLSANGTYFYRVRGTNGAGDGSYSASSSALTLPDIPGTPSYSSIASSSLVVTWTAPTGGADSYIVQRATSSQVYAQVATPTGVSTSDTGLTASTTYYYRVEGVNSTGNGAFSATSSVTTSPASANAAPNAPFQSSPVVDDQDLPLAPTFTMVASDPDNNKLQYKVTIYSNVGCTTVVQTNDQKISQTGWSGQNASSSAEYNSGSTATFQVVTSLTANTTYYWKASAIDPEGSNTWTDSSTCHDFVTTFGNWVTDTGNWSVSNNVLFVIPSNGSSVQIRANVAPLTNAIIEYKGQANVVGPNTGLSSSFIRGDAAGANRYDIAFGDFQNMRGGVGKTISGAYTALASTTFTFVSSTPYDFRGIISGTTIKSWTNASNVFNLTDSSISGPGYLGLMASSTAGTSGFAFDDFAVYTGTIITFNNLPASGSWAVLNHNGTIVTGSCETASTWDFSITPVPPVQVPIDYSNGGGRIAVWSGNGSCNGSSTATYPSSGLDTNIFGGDIYTYATSSGYVMVQQSTPVATSTISVSALGAVTY